MRRVSRDQECFLAITGMYKTKSEKSRNSLIVMDVRQPRMHRNQLRLASTSDHAKSTVWIRSTALQF